MPFWTPQRNLDADASRGKIGLAWHIESKFERMEYTEAIRILEKSGETFEFPVSWGIDLQSEHERYLTEKVLKGPAAVVNYPKDIKAFYMRLNPDGKTVAAMDVLAPGIGGSQREERLDRIDARIAEMGLHAPTTSGTAICAATAPSRTPASASASSTRSSMPPASTTSAT